MHLHDQHAASTSVVRRYARSMFSVPIELRYLAVGGIRISRGVSLDISEGGMGALVPCNLRIGDTVTISLPLSAQTLRAVAIVRYAADGRSGFEFLGLTPEERSTIASASAVRSISAGTA